MSSFRIADRLIGAGQPPFVIAEVSANHDRDLNQALTLIDVAAESGADCVKLQTYTADSLTMRTSHESARVDPEWGAANLYELYQKSAMPLDFHKPLFQRARERKLIAFSSVYDVADVDFLEQFDVPAYKVASFELVHLPLLRRLGETKKPVIISTGMASLGEIEEGLSALSAGGAGEIMLLHCCSSYPAEPETINLAAMATMRRAFGLPVGFSDHTLGSAVAIAAAALGAAAIEKHFTNDPQRSGPDHRFSIDPRGLRELVSGTRQAHVALGDGIKRMRPCEATNKAVGRRSLFSATHISAGTTIEPHMLKVIRPGSGLHPRYLQTVSGRAAQRDIEAGRPLQWEDV